MTNLSVIDRLVLKIGLLATYGYPVEAYQRLVEAGSVPELRALMAILRLDPGNTTVQRMAQAIYETDWQPLLKERRALMQDPVISELVTELNGILSGETTRPTRV